MKVEVKKWGNSAAIRIPASIMNDAKLALDQIVSVRHVNNQIVIEPIAQDTYDLKSLVKKISLKNTHSAIDFGAPQGKEVL